MDDSSPIKVEASAEVSTFSKVNPKDYESKDELDMITEFKKREEIMI